MKYITRSGHSKVKKRNKPLLNEKGRHVSTNTALHQGDDEDPDCLVFFICKKYINSNKCSNNNESNVEIQRYNIITVSHIKPDHA